MHHAELLNVVAKVQPNCHILVNLPPPKILTQFLLDCTSFNLPDNIRIPFHNPGISEIYRISRDWCYAVSKERFRLLNITASEDDFLT